VDYLATPGLQPDNLAQEKPQTPRRCGGKWFEQEPDRFGVKRSMKREQTIRMALEALAHGHAVLSDSTGSAAIESLNLYLLSTPSTAEMLR
jgi:hypothetical protein